MGASNSEAHKQAATDFLKLVVSGRIDEAYQKHVDMQGKHHNPFFPAGFAALRNAMSENHTQMPHKTITFKNVLGDGDLVAVHSQLLLKPGGEKMTTVHLFRFRGDKVVEMWDCGQPVPVDSPNSDGPF